MLCFPLLQQAAAMVVLQASLKRVSTLELLQLPALGLQREDVGSGMPLTDAPGAVVACGIHADMPAAVRDTPPTEATVAWKTRRSTRSRSCRRVPDCAARFCVANAYDAPLCVHCSWRVICASCLGVCWVFCGVIHASLRAALQQPASYLDMGIRVNTQPTLLATWWKRWPPRG